MDKIARRTFMQRAAGLALAGSAGQLFAGARDAFAQATETWPNRPVRFIVPLAPGGGLDFIARATGDFLSRTMGQQFVIENRSGGGGTIGTEAVVRSAPDGYTILVTNDNITSAPHILKLGGDYLKELVPVGLLSRQPLVVAVHPSLNLNSLPELIAMLKQRPGTGYASSGVGSNQHVLGELFARLNDIKLDHVPYRGAGQAINDFLAGHVKVAVLGPTALIAHHKSGAVKILAQSSDQRAPYLPDIPTLPELGFKDLNIESWYGVFVPVGTSPAIIARLNTEMGKAMADPGIREKLHQSAQEPVGGTPEQFAKLVREYSDRYERHAKELNLKLN